MQTPNPDLDGYNAGADDVRRLVKLSSEAADAMARERKLPCLPPMLHVLYRREPGGPLGVVTCVLAPKEGDPASAAATIARAGASLREADALPAAVCLVCHGELRTRKEPGRKPGAPRVGVKLVWPDDEADYGPPQAVVMSVGCNVDASAVAGCFATEYRSKGRLVPPEFGPVSDAPGDWSADVLIPFWQGYAGEYPG